jgi:hypothetical protein
MNFVLRYASAGLHIDPNNQQMQSALSDAMSAKNRPPAGEARSLSCCQNTPNGCLMQE